MTNEDIIRMAKEAEAWSLVDHDGIAALERFANLVAAAEREACAQIAFNANTYLEAAAAIRARGQGWVKTYSGGKPNYTQPIEREPYPENFIDALRFDAAQSEPVIQARKEGDLIVADLPQVPRGSGGITKDEQPEPEPVAWISHNAGLYHGKPDESLNPLPLYTAPPKKEWVGLTDEEIREGNKDSWVTRQAWESAAWWAEAKLKEKNT